MEGLGLTAWSLDDGRDSRLIDRSTDRRLGSGYGVI